MKEALPPGRRVVGVVGVTEQGVEVPLTRSHCAGVVGKGVDMGNRWRRETEVPYTSQVERGHKENRHAALGSTNDFPRDVRVPARGIQRFVLHTKQSPAIRPLTTSPESPENTPNAHNHY